MVSSELTLSCIAVTIRDTDELREVCSGMYGGKDAYIQRQSLGPGAFITRC